MASGSLVIVLSHLWGRIPDQECPLHEGSWGQIKRVGEQALPRHGEETLTDQAVQPAALRQVGCYPLGTGESTQVCLDVSRLFTCEQHTISFPSVSQLQVKCQVCLCVFEGYFRGKHQAGTSLFLLREKLFSQWGKSWSLFVECITRISPFGKQYYLCNECIK